MRKLSYVQLFAALMFLGCGSDANPPNTSVVNQSALSASGVDVSLTVSSDWGSGYCANVTLKNGSSAIVTNWSVVVQLNQSSLSQIWGATSAASGTQITATAVSYDQTIAVGTTVSFGFCGTGAGRPTVASATITGGGQSSGTGGAAASGGAKATGGALPTGGARATGGSPTTGGSRATGGTTSTGGGRKFVGNIDTNGSIRSDFATYWNQFTPENAGKWGSVQPSSQSSFSWGSLDASYSYCNSHNIIFKQHNFVWGAQQPSWTSSLTSSNGPAAVQNWMKSFCARYPNTKYIDVVNEPPPHTTPAYINAIGGTGSSGYDWIVNAFKWARAACPNSTLILNDYNIIEYSGDHNNIINIVNKVKAAGAPIDAIGAQAHAAYSFSANTVQGYIDDLTAKTGLPVFITEFDINVADDTQQATIMQNLFTMFWNDNNVKGITLWGYIQGSTWLPNSGLMSSSGTMRPAMTWLSNFLKTH